MNLKGARVVVTGGTGNLGSELVPLLEKEGAFVVAPSRDEMDIANGHSVGNFFSKGRGMGCDMLIHCAAYTNVPDAQLPSNHRKVINTNILGTAYLASWAKHKHFKFVYISTDYVYEGTEGGYEITDIPRPFCFYGYSKLAGEAFIPGNGLVIRTSFLPRGYWGEDKLTKVFKDVYTSKDWVDIIAKKIVKRLGDSGVINVGTERKSLRDLAVQEYPNVEELDVADTEIVYKYPTDSSMKVTI
tara:strand:+ start:7242 stop:7970 length:729 start_codon:yes stop_codon:yes gene_type:complete